MASHIDRIINQLGYSDTQFLLYEHSFNDLTALPVQIAKVLNELSPYAAYMVNGKPFILFFDEDESADPEQQKAKNRKIWNAQIPVVLFCSTRSVSIYNGYTIDPESASFTEIIKPLSLDAIDENSPFSYWDITSRNFWELHGDKYSGQRLNEALLENLKDLTEKLKRRHRLESEMATKLVLRVIFIRYLIDRGVDLDYPGFASDVMSARIALLEAVKNKQSLYSLFAHLKVNFNGNLFDLSGDEDDHLITENVLSEVADFLSGRVVTKSGQLCIYDMYDFNIIPVELISNIYEILLSPKTRKKDNAFYTPHYLVDYILDDVISEHVRMHGSCKVLDPACGSGIFLVESYRRMVEQELKLKPSSQPFTEDDLFLQKTLTNNIFGIDLNTEAIDVAIFSLYIAALDYKNPKTLQSFQLPPLKDKNLLNCDFFNEDALSKLQHDSKKSPFDFIIGNPPWGTGTDLQANYCIQRGYKKFDYKNDTCRMFILRSRDFSEANTKCCFILRSTMLYLQKGPSKKFREYLLEHVKISRVIEFSSVRDKIFKNATAPAIIFSYSFSDINTLEHYFQHISMKPNIFFNLFSIVVVEKTDVKYVPQSLLKQYDWAWKTIVYGYAYDIYTIATLKALTMGQAIKREMPALISSYGVKYNDGDKNDASHLFERPLLISKKSIDHFSIDLSKMGRFSKKEVDRPRDPSLFEAPYCLMMRGPDVSDYTMKAVYSDVDFVFKDAVLAIKGSSEQKPFLFNLVGLLNSKVYAYFNLMLGSSIGIEREQQHKEEVLLFPFIYDDDIAARVELIQQKKAASGEFVVAEDASNEIQELNQVILAAFGLTDNVFVDYALHIQIPQLTGKNDEAVYRNADEQDFVAYGKRFFDHFSAIFARSQRYVQIKVYLEIARYYSAFEVIIGDSKPTDLIQFVPENTDVEKTLLAKLSAHQGNGQFYHLKDVLYFEKNSFCIIKPRHYKNWHPAVAQLDLAEVADRILSENGGAE